MSLDAQLVAACSSENPSWATIESLLKQGADGNASDAESLSCVWHLIYTEHVELACKFIDFCCDSREYKGRKLNLDVRDDGGEGTTYLCLACFEGLEDLAKCLIKHGAKLEERDNGFTPLALAAYTGRPALVQLLLLSGANPVAKHAQSQESVLTLAVHNGQVEVANMIVAKIGVQGLVGERESVVEFLVKNGVVQVGEK